MKLLIDCHVFDGKFQGTRTYLQGLYANLTKHQDIDFYFAANDINNLKKIFGEGNNIYYIVLNSKGSVKRLAYELPMIIRKYGIDYAHYQYVSPIIKYCKEIVTIHDLLFMDFPEYFPLMYRLKNRLLFKRSSQNADILLTVSNYSKGEIEKFFGIDPDNIYITPNGVLPIENFANIPDVRSKYNLDKYILTVSRIEPRKNHQLLLKAFVELRLYEKGYKLVLVGSRDLNNKPFYDYYASLQLDIQKCISILEVSYMELMSLYKYSNLFVFPSFAEGFGIPPIEAVSLGCTTLCSNQTAMSDFEFLDDKLFNPNDLEELKQKIRYYLSNVNVNLAYEQKIIEKKYNWGKIADYLYNIIIKDRNNR